MDPTSFVNKQMC